ncbi:hypothetical protein RJ639_018766, partial [Escallonia herrerae]
PVQDVADSCRTGVATNVIFGLALGYKSVIIPIFAIVVAIYCYEMTSSPVILLVILSTSGFHGQSSTR